MDRTFVYIDGFNLFYGALKDQPNKRWLDIKQLIESILPSNPKQNDIQRIKYFSAKITSRANHPRQVKNQETYLKALGTIPILDIILGRYDTHIIKAKLETPLPDGTAFVNVFKTEEKGSDVNLATHLLHDAHSNAFDTAIVVTNDSDLALPIEFITANLHKKVGIISPYKNSSKHLAKVSTFIRKIRSSNVTSSQFPQIIQMPDGTSIEKPENW